MRMKLALSVIGLCAFSPGCGLAVNATRNLVAEMSEAQDGHRENIWHRKLANSAWNSLREARPGQTYSKDYVQGFKEGFVDSLDTGGTGQAPPLAPRKYLTGRCQTPQGYQTMEEWFAGFRHGAAVAKGSGYCRGITPLHPSDSAPQHLYPAEKRSTPQQTPEPVLPLPRKVEPGHT